MNSKMNEVEQDIHDLLEQNKELTAPEVPDDISTALSVHIQGAAAAHYMRYGRKAKYVLLNRTAYGALRLIKRNMIKDQPLVEESLEEFDGYTIICDPDQTVIARVLPDPEGAFSYLFDTEWEKMRKVYEDRVAEIEQMLDIATKENEQLIERYDVLQKEVKVVKKKGTQMVLIMLGLFILLQLLEGLF